MPFTFSHPAIVLPFLKIRKEWVSMSGLIIGTMTPDFEYFLKMKLSGRIGHSIEGMFLFDLPVAFLIAFIFHLLVKKPLINNSPRYFYERLISLRDFDFLAHTRKHFVGFACCVLIGSGSHILWDSFTHPREYYTGKIPFLLTSLSIDGLFSLPLYNLLQHASTAIGAVIILVIFHRQPIEDQENSPSIIFWIVSLVAASLAFTIRALFKFDYLGDIVCTIISAGFIGLIVSSLFTRLRWIR
ncbi:MAG TPA: DUF4184 family protein [Cyclobacteriaceae bacterium]|nr:DUF4184 family protein [Cyclobacteriaceae bacterium]